MPVFREDVVAGHIASIFKRQRVSVRCGRSIIYNGSVHIYVPLEASIAFLEEHEQGSLLGAFHTQFIIV